MFRIRKKIFFFEEKRAKNVRISNFEMTQIGRVLLFCKSGLTATTFSRAYRSPYSLEKLYPDSVSDSQKFSIPINPSKPGDKEFNGFIPLDKLEIKSDLPKSRATEIRFRIKDCDWIPTSIKEKFFQKYGHRIDKDGFFSVRSDRTRVTSMNVADCLDKLRFSINECASDERPRSKVLRRPTTNSGLSKKSSPKRNCK